MKQFLIITALLIFSFGIIFWANPGRSQQAQFEVPTEQFSIPVAPENRYLDTPTTCAIQPETSQSLPFSTSPSLVTLSSFRSESFSNSYMPREEISLADSSNYGQRFLNDLYGRPADLAPIVVIHETVGSANSAINTFRTRHTKESNQVSYHTLIRRDGTVVYIVPPEFRAFGAGNSVFAGENGIETVKVDSKYPPSVNNFAYHISLETPGDGRNNRSRHSGYTKVQYQSLAWLVAKTGVADNRITTHKSVDRSGLRRDPRSFNSKTFRDLLETFPRSNDIVVGCQSLGAF